MKTTIDLPDQLMAEVQNLAAREQRKVSELVAEFVRVGIESRTNTVDADQQRAEAARWLEEWVKFGDETLRDVPPGPTANEILEEDRNRLERSE